MCLGKVVVKNRDNGAREIADVIEVSVDKQGVKLVTLFGEQHAFADRTIEHVDMRAGLVISLSGEGA